MWNACALQAEGRLLAKLDPAALAVMLMTAAMALPRCHEIEGISGVDPRSAEYIEHFAAQVALLARHIGLDTPDANA